MKKILYSIILSFSLNQAAAASEIYCLSKPSCVIVGGFETNPYQIFGSYLISATLNIYPIEQGQFKMNINIPCGTKNRAATYLVTLDVVGVYELELQDAGSGQCSIENFQLVFHNAQQDAVAKIDRVEFLTYDLRAPGFNGRLEFHPLSSTKK